VLLFLAVAGGVIAVAYLAVAGPDGSDRADRSTTSTGPTTTTVAKPAGPYRVTTGVNVRQGPGLNFATVGTIETGHSVFVACVIEGASVDGITKWVRLAGFGPSGYLTVRYLDTGDDLNIEGKIPGCAT
jgi:Bacterial SH3 domain